MTFFTPFSPSTVKTRARSRIVVGLGLSILIHVTVLLCLRPAVQKVSNRVDAARAPLEVTFVTPAPAVVRQPAPPRKARHSQKPAPPRKASASSRPKTTPTPQPAQLATSSAIAEASPPMDMSTLLNAARNRRRAAEASAASENAAARLAEEGPTGDDIARANIAFQARKASGGTNGVFEIVSKGPRVAQYVFRGWTTDVRHSQRQTITVDAGSGGDIEKAIIDSMIALIRKYYSGDFNWDSQKLGRVVSLSARPSDTAGLQAFLLREFFG